jgi:hypothetical protein
MFAWAKRAPLKAAITTFVLCCHLFILIKMSVQLRPDKIVKKQIAVRTLSKSEPTVKPMKAAAPAARPPSPPVKKEAPKPPLAPEPVKKTAPPIADKKVSKAPPQKKKEIAPRPKISPDLLRDLEESIAKIDEKRDKLHAKKRELSKNKQSDEIKAVQPTDYAALAESANVDDYQSLLVSYLRGELQLPEFGEVKIELTLHSNGSVAKWVVVKSESEKNRKHLESKLPHMKFPPPGKLLFGKEQHQFVLTFCNEI